MTNAPLRTNNSQTSKKNLANYDTQVEEKRILRREGLRDEAFKAIRVSIRVGGWVVPVCAIILALHYFGPGWVRWIPPNDLLRIEGFFGGGMIVAILAYGQNFFKDS